MEDTHGYTYLKFEPKHCGDLVVIIKRAFRKTITIKHLENKYNSDYLGIDTISTIAYDGSIPIGFYGAIPQTFKDENNEFLVAHACDSYTIPGYQKKGIHYNLARLSYELMKSHDVKMVYAYHSDNTYHSTKKLNWKEHINLKRFHIHTGALPFSKIVKKVGAAKAFQKAIARKFAPYLSPIEGNPFLREKRICQAYTKPFYQYKDGISQHYHITIDDCTYFIKADSILLVGHVRFSDNRQLKQSIQTLKKLCKAIGINEILFQVDPNSKLYPALYEMTEPLPSWLIGYLSFDETLDISQMGFNFSELDTF